MALGTRAEAQSTSSCVNLTVNMRYRSTDAQTGGAVTALQRFLNTSGYLSVAPTGFFGLATRAGVSAFQSRYNIPANPMGYVGPMTREKIYQVSCALSGGTLPPTGGSGQGITVSYPAGYGTEDHVAGGQIMIAIDNPVPNPSSSPLGMSYAVDLVKGDNIVQRLGTVYVPAATSRHQVTFTLSSALDTSGNFRIKVSPSCVVATSFQCRQAFSNSFLIRNASNPQQQAFVDIVMPTGWTMATGSTQTLQLNIPSDRIYSLSYYLIPLSGTIATGGAYYDYASGGYSIGGFTPSVASAQVNTTFTIPSNIPAGTYKLRVYLRNAGDTTASPTMWSSLAYDESNSITIGTASGTGTIAPIALSAGAYRLVSHRGVAVPTTGAYSVQFSSALGNGTVSASLCNGQSGSYTRSGNTITGYATMSTLMMCQDATRQAIESGFWSMMMSGAVISMESGQLVLTRNNGDRFVFISESVVVLPPAVNPVTLQLLYPVGGETWRIGSTQEVRIMANNVPAGAVVLVRLSNGGVLLNTANIPASGIMSFVVPADIFIGDVGGALNPGQYGITVSIYNKAPCFGLCPPDFVNATLLASKTSAGTVTIQRNTDPVLDIITPASGAVIHKPYSVLTQWIWSNLDVDQFDVRLENKLVPNYSVKVAANVSTTANAATFAVTEGMMSEFIARSGGKTRAQIQSKFYIRVQAQKRVSWMTLDIADRTGYEFTLASTTAPIVVD
jgi:heat shock protein HslJ